MKMKIIISIALAQFLLTGCSYVSDYVEGEITNRASFSIEAEQSGSSVIITWKETDSSSDFAGIEIYRTRKANDEYAGYVLVANRFNGSLSGNLSNGSTTSCTVNGPSLDGATVPAGTSGIYFYRVGLIHWDESEDDRTAENGYTGDTETDYNNCTDIDEVSGSARVEIN